MDELVEEARSRAQVVLLDFHAEATSEKVAIARWLDGRVTAVLGTHTHIQTNDARVQPGGTAAITDAGMTGPHDSVIGVDADAAIQRMRTGMAVRFRPAEGDVRIEGVLVECDDDGRAVKPCGGGAVAVPGESRCSRSRTEMREASRSGRSPGGKDAATPSRRRRGRAAHGPGSRETGRNPTTPEARGDARRADDPHCA